jgi:hypothetical protein
MSVGECPSAGLEHAEKRKRILTLPGIEALIIGFSPP